MARYQNIKFKMAALFHDGRHFTKVKPIEFSIIFDRAS